MKILLAGIARRERAADHSTRGVAHDHNLFDVTQAKNTQKKNRADFSRSSSTVRRILAAKECNSAQRGANAQSSNI
jgi:hypothetical protein